MGEDSHDLLKPGDVFLGYVVQKLLGTGGGGSVYLVPHEVLDTLFALKVLDPQVAENDQTHIKRFLREARLATRIRHPGLVTVHDCGYDNGRKLYYLVMDYVPGSSLRDAIAFEGKLSVEKAVDVVAQVAEALDAAQTFNVVHRDIKPENILIQPDGRVKLVDLGIAKAQNLGDSLRTSTDNVFGTPSYISPEQAECSAEVDSRADIYSLGVMFFEMLTGKCPYVGANPAKILEQILSDDPIPDVRDETDGVSPELAILVRRMTAKDKARRIPTFGAVLKEIDKLGIARAVRANPAPEYAAAPAAGMKTLISGLERGATSDVDPLAMPDDDIREFLAKKARNRAKATLLWVLAGACVAAAAVACILLLR